MGLLKSGVLTEFRVNGIRQEYIVGPTATLISGVESSHVTSEEHTDYSIKEAWFVYRTSTTLLNFSMVSSAASYPLSRSVSSKMIKHPAP